MPTFTDLITKFPIHRKWASSPAIKILLGPQKSPDQFTIVWWLSGNFPIFWQYLLPNIMGQSASTMPSVLYQFVYDWLLIGC